MTVPLLQPSPFTAPTFSPIYIPDLSSLGLSEDEKATISRLQMRAWRAREWMQLTDAYYRGMQIVANLGIAIPPELSDLRVLVGWPKVAVDPYVERLSLDSFRVGNSLTADETLMDLWTHAGMESEQSVAFLESLVMGRAYYTLGSGDDPDDPPCIGVESPLNMSVNWDSRTRKPKEALQSFWMDARRHGVLMLLNQTVYIAENDNGQWEIVNRDVHNFGMVPLIRQSNRPRAADRDGSSEITPELMSITDAACRAVLNLSVAGEFYSVPQKLILGTTEDAFVGKDGTAKSAWQTYVSNILALDRDEEGALPDVKQFKAYDPSVFTKVIEMYASQAAGIMAATPQDLGLYTSGNPVSADAWQVSEGRRDRRARRMTADFGVALVELGQMAMRFVNNKKGELPKGYEKLTADWADPTLPNFTGMADGMSKLMTEGAIPRFSDVALKKLGFCAVDRRRIAQERKSDIEGLVVRAIATDVEAKDIRSANALASAAASSPGAAPAPPAAVSAAAPTSTP